MTKQWGSWGHAQPSISHYCPPLDITDSMKDTIVWEQLAVKMSSGWDECTLLALSVTSVAHD